MDINVIKYINNRDLQTRSISDIKAIIVHHTGSKASDEDILNYLSNTQEVSCHYLIDSKANIYQLVDDDKIAYHAGKSRYNGLVSKNNSLNWCTIGIEIHSDGYNFTKEQKRNTYYLIKDLMKKYNIPSNFVLRHKDISLSGKWDVGDNFWNDMFDSWKSYQKNLDLNINRKNNIDEKQIKAINALIAINSALWYDINDNEIKMKLEEFNSFLKRKIITS